MGKVYKEYYQCVGCGTEFDTPDKVRIFKDEVMNGNETKIYINPNDMYCIDCLKLILDFDNKVPETVQIKIPEKKYIRPTTLDDLEKRVNSLDGRLSNIEETSDGEISTDEKIALVKAIKTMENTKFDDFPPMKKESQPENSIAPKTTIENVETEIIREEADQINKDALQRIENLSKTVTNITEETNILDDILPEDLISIDSSGPYLILCEILTEEHELDLAKRCGYKDVKSLMEMVGNKSLKGTYYSPGKYTDSVSIFEEMGHITKQVKVVNKIFFGVPNIVERTVEVFPDFNIALIEKDLFEDEVIPLEIPKPPPEPEENQNVIPEINLVASPETSREILEKKIKEVRQRSIETKTPIITAKQKKKFSKDHIGDDDI